MNQGKFLVLSLLLMIAHIGVAYSINHAEGACFEGNCAAQLKKLRRLASFGSPDAQAILAQMYLTDHPLAKREDRPSTWYKKRAFIMYKRAAKNRRRRPPMLPAIHQTGMMLIKGVGVKQDVKLGISYLKRAANADWTKSQFVLGMEYYAGFHVAIDYVKARKWLLRSALKGKPLAAFYAASLAEYGKGGEQDFALSYQLLRLAAAKEHQGAIERLSEIDQYQSGDDNVSSLTLALINAKDQFEAQEKLRNSENETKVTQQKVANSSASITKTLISKNKISPYDDDNKLVIKASRTTITPELINIYVQSLQLQGWTRRGGSIYNGIYP